MFIQVTEKYDILDEIDVEPYKKSDKKFFIFVTSDKKKCVVREMTTKEIEEEFITDINVYREIVKNHLSLLRDEKKTIIKI